MKMNRKVVRSVICVLLALIFVISLMTALIPTNASAASQSEINRLTQQRKELQAKQKEQQKTINDTNSPRIKDNDIVIEELNMSDEEIKEITKIHIVACGSAYHTGVTAKYVIEGLARIPVEVDVASEFRYRDPILQKGNMVIVISQSGETADTLAALRESRERGFKVLGIVNVVGSSIAREADSVMYTWQWSFPPH